MTMGDARMDGAIDGLVSAILWQVRCEARLLELQEEKRRADAAVGSAMASVRSIVGNKGNEGDEPVPPFTTDDGVTVIGSAEVPGRIICQAPVSGVLGYRLDPADDPDMGN